MTNLSFSNCKRADIIVAYMYGELTAAETSSFESHLPDCIECMDEFAEISSTRYEVYEWKKLQFDHLATPAIRIPCGSEPASVRMIEKVRMAFGGWGVPGVAFAGLVIALMMGSVFIWNDLKGDVVAVNATVSSKPAETARADEVVQSPAAPTAPTAVASDEEMPPSRRVNAPIRVTRPTVVASRVPSTPSRRETKHTSAHNLTRNVPAVRNETRNVPTLNDFDEDEDTSLRLAQLFDDIETSD